MNIKPLLFFVVVSLLFGCEKKEVGQAKPSQPPASTPVTIIKDPKDAQKERIKEISSGNPSVQVDFSSIRGRKLGGLYADITGVEGVVGTTHTVNYHRQLAHLWFRKLDRHNVSKATIDSAHIPIELYTKDPRTMTLVQFVAEAEKQVALVKLNLNHQAACKDYALTEPECKTWKMLAQDVRGIDLVAYGLTELMPSAEGDLNVKILDIILRNAGSNYIFTIPALYDRMLSLGFYQFTSYAVNQNANAGASRMNKYLPAKVRIPGSVISLHNGEHHRAAYLFALDNFANLAKRTNEKEFAALKRALKQKPGDIVTFMAVAHHAPGLAIKCTRNWLGKGARGSLNAHLVGRLVPYGTKSDNNLRALETFIK